MLGLFSFFLVLVILESSNLTNEIAGFVKVLFFFKLFVFGLFALDIFYDLIKGKIKINWILSVLSVIVLATLFITKKPHMLILLLLMVEISKYKFSQVAKVALITFQVCFALIVFLTALGIIPNAINLRGDGEIRNSLGFNYVLTAQTIYFFIILISVFLKKNNMPFSELLFHFIIVSILFFYTDARCDFCLSLVLLTMVCLVKLFKFKKAQDVLKTRVCKILLISVPILITAVSGLLLLLYSLNVSFVVNLDVLLDGRLNMALRVLNEFGVHLFGSEFINVHAVYVDGLIIPDENYLFLDNSIFSILLMYGIFNLIAILIGYSLIIKKGMEKQNYWFVLCVVLIFVQSLVEPYLIAYNFNIFVLALAYLLEVRNKKEEVTDKFNNEIDNQKLIKESEQTQ